MKTDNVRLIKKLGRLGVLDVEPCKNNYRTAYSKDTDITIENSSGVTCKVITDNVADEDMQLMIMAEQLETLKAIKSMVKYFFVSSLIAVGIWVIYFLIMLGDKF